MAPRVWPEFGPKGLDWQDTTRYRYKLNQKAVGLMASATSEKILKLSHYKSMGALCYPWQPFR